MKNLYRSTQKKSEVNKQGIFKAVLLNKIRYLEYEKTPRMTEYDFISNWGGFFGLFLGFSIISFFEIIYWFVWKIPLGFGR